MLCVKLPAKSQSEPAVLQPLWSKGTGNVTAAQFQLHNPQSADTQWKKLKDKQYLSLDEHFDYHFDSSKSSTDEHFDFIKVLHQSADFDAKKRSGCIAGVKV